MIAEFYLIADSFAQNVCLSVSEIENKIKCLANDIQYIRKYKDTNKIFVHAEIYEVNFINGISVSDLLFNTPVSERHLDRDTRILLQRIIYESPTITEITSEEFKQVLLPSHDANSCYGLIAFNLIEDVDPAFQVIYDLNGWLTFRRHFLGLYPQNAFFFVDECAKYFPNLYFHERIKTSINSILFNFPKKIIFHLAALNNQFRYSQQPGLNRTQVLQAFSANANLDETASLEGNAARKTDFTFNFLDDNNQIYRICCEPHLKLCRNDNYPGDQSYSYNRIYFHEGVNNIQEGKILIGHIGNHL
jgi:hypothetical protein